MINADDDRLVDLWLSNCFADEDGGYPDAAATEDVASALAWLDQGFSERLDRIDAHIKVRVQLLARVLARQRSDQRVERTAHKAALGNAVARIVALEGALRTQAEEHGAALAEMRKSIGAVELGAARDRSLRRLVDARRSYPHADRTTLEAAKRKTDAALGETRQ